MVLKRIWLLILIRHIGNQLAKRGSGHEGQRFSRLLILAPGWGIFIYSTSAFLHSYLGVTILRHIFTLVPNNFHTMAKINPSAERAKALYQRPITTVNAEKEYDSIRDESLKLMEFQHKTLTAQLAFVGAFFGFGFGKDAILFLVVPPFVFLLGIVYQHYKYKRFRIAAFIKNKYESKDSPLSWETYIHAQAMVQKVNIIRIFLKFGIMGLFLITSSLGLVLGVLKNECSPTVSVMVVIDCVSIACIIALFALFNTRRMRNNIEVNF